MEKEYKYYIWFDRSELEVDSNGSVINRDALYIAEYDDDGNFIRRVECKYPSKIYEIPMDISVEEMESFEEYACGDTFSDAFNDLYDYLEEFYIEVETSRQTYWQPAEYAIVGLR